MTATESLLRCCITQVASTGKTTIAKAVTVQSGGLLVQAIGATIVGGVTNNGNMVLTSGAMSVGFTSATGNALDVQLTGSSLNGNAFVGRIASNGGTPNLLSLMEGNNALLTVGCYQRPADCLLPMTL